MAAKDSDPYWLRLLDHPGWFWGVVAVLVVIALAAIVAGVYYWRAIHQHTSGRHSG